jgi:hypothetical protein
MSDETKALEEAAKALDYFGAPIVQDVMSSSGASAVATRENFDRAAAVFRGALLGVTPVQLAALICESVRSRSRFVVPDDAAPIGSVIAVGYAGARAEVVSYVFDSEGSFGYLCGSEHRGGPHVFQYHFKGMPCWAMVRQ